MTMSHTPSLHRVAAAAATIFCGACTASAFGCYHAPSGAPRPGAEPVRTIANVGFDEPENLVYDSASDVYLVSNIVGEPATRDNNGFISRVSPDGQVIALKWIAGGVNGAVLDAPKGLAIRGDTLVVADVGAVHLFDRRTGAPIATHALPGLVMNDVAWGADGTLWITDTGPDRSKTPVDTTKDLDAVWQIMPDGRVRAVARGLALDRPDGILLDDNGALVTTFGANRIEHVNARGERGQQTVMTLPAGRVDGLRRLPDGAMVVTSWDAKSVYRARPGDSLRVLLTDVTSPAGVAVDTKRERLAVTSMQNNTLYLLPLPR
jgi:sugar lactone lactonase YvrE